MLPNILVFLPTLEIMLNLQKLLENEKALIFGECMKLQFIVQLFHEEMSRVDIQSIMSTPKEEDGQPFIRVILASNLAESNITLPNIKYVIDSGFEISSIFDEYSRESISKIVTISQSSALQRAGRAGRTSTGFCYKLYTKIEEEAFFPRMKVDLNTIGDLTSTVLTCYYLNDLVTVDELPVICLNESEWNKKILKCLFSATNSGILNEQGLTDKGKLSLDLGINLDLAIFLHNLLSMGVRDEAINLCNILQLLDSKKFPNIFEGYREAFLKFESCKENTIEMSLLDDQVQESNEYSIQHSNNYLGDFDLILLLANCHPTISLNNLNPLIEDSIKIDSQDLEAIELSKNYLIRYSQNFYNLGSLGALLRESG